MQKLAKACKISVATLYIYYQNKEDLIKRLTEEISNEFYESLLEGFNPQQYFRDGLWKQWVNRTNFTLQFPEKVRFYEYLRNSPLHSYTYTDRHQVMKDTFSEFLEINVARGEIKAVSWEIYWSVAHSPIYQLLTFHRNGDSYPGESYAFTGQEMKSAFEIVYRALR